MLIQIVWDFFSPGRSYNFRYPFKLKLYCFKPKLHDTSSFFLCATAPSASWLHRRLVSLHPHGNCSPSHGKLCTGSCGSLSLCFHLKFLFMYFMGWEGDKADLQVHFVIVTLPNVGK